jgi:hypothetical protein
LASRAGDGGAAAADGASVSWPAGSNAGATADDIDDAQPPRDSATTSVAALNRFTG